MCGNYEIYPNFKRKVLDIAKKEINDWSDLLIDFKPVKDGRRFAKIAFTINLKKAINRALKRWLTLKKTMKKQGNTK
jgi:plasmid replication initiation protein